MMAGWRQSMGNFGANRINENGLAGHNNNGRLVAGIFLFSFWGIWFLFAYLFGDSASKLLIVAPAFIIAFALSATASFWLHKMEVKAEQKRKIEAIGVAGKFEEKQIEERRKRAEKIDKVYK